MLSVTIQSIMLNAVMLKAVMLNAVMLNVKMLNVIMLNVLVLGTYDKSSCYIFDQIFMTKNSHCHHHKKQHLRQAKTCTKQRNISVIFFISFLMGKCS
jgi:hypothetical protein